MKSPYVSELQPNQVITATFLVQQKDIRQKKSGEPYLSLVLCDRTGDLEAKMWDNVADVMNTFDRDDYIRVRGLLQVYQNRLQLTVHKLQVQPDSSVDPADYFPASSRDPDEMFAELLGVVSSVRTDCLRDLLRGILTDPDIASRYKSAPAAKNIHHAWLGGLIEHVLSMCGLARLIASHYPDIDLDLLLAGVILHDIGKIFELSYDRSFGYSSEGQLLGHIMIGVRLIDEKLRACPDFPPRMRTLLEHMILSHHGSFEFGSPRVPMFPEALVLHYIDTIDSKMECMRSFVEKDRGVDGCWTAYVSSLERPVLKKRKYLEEKAADPATAAAAVAARSGASPAPHPSAPVSENLRHDRQTPESLPPAPHRPQPTGAVQRQESPSQAAPRPAPIQPHQPAVPAAQVPQSPEQPHAPVPAAQRPQLPQQRPPQQSLFAEKLQGALRREPRE